MAIARSRLSQDCELVREVIARWAGQNCWELCMTVKCWLSVGKGEVAAELLGRLGDTDSLRVAASLIREAGWEGEFQVDSVSQTVCIKETLS